MGEDSPPIPARERPAPTKGGDGPLGWLSGQGHRRVASLDTVAVAWPGLRYRMKSISR